MSDANSDKQDTWVHHRWSFSHPVASGDLPAAHLQQPRPGVSACRFENVFVGGTEVVGATDFKHQPHHRFFKSNYETIDAP